MFRIVVILMTTVRKTV